MTTPAYNIGSQKRLTAIFTDINGTEVDPTAITLTIREPDGNLVTALIGGLTKTGTGVYYYDHTIAKPGRHVYNFTGDEGTFAAFEAEFYARRTDAAA